MTENPGELVAQAVERSLALIVTWPAWDGEPRASDDDRIFTPHKAVRRIADHLIELDWYAEQVGGRTATTQ